METRREILLSVGGLVLLNLLLAFGAIGLFVRMGPAIERILQENVTSIVAAEEILAAVAAAGGEALDPAARKRVRAAVERASRNVTEAQERPVLRRLGEQLPGALAGHAPARTRVVEELRSLIRINRQAMGRVDARARRLGAAGAWAAVLVGLLSFLLSLVVVARLQRRLVGPLSELFEVITASQGGDRLRRCSPGDAPREVVQVARAVNRLLDERLSRGDPR